jgi:acetate---CoA ligase (ADP-forming) subunit beta
MKIKYEDIIASCYSNSCSFIPEPDAYEICAAFDIPHPRYLFMRTKKECLHAAAEIGYPVVIKIVSPEVIHKSEVGGVILDLRTPQELEEGFERLQKNVREKAGDPPISGILVQQSMAGGVEVAVGGANNAQFGPVVMFGSGGILIEVFKDVSFRLAPLDQGEARRQIEETRAYEILKGVRGREACDLEAICQVMVNTGRLLTDIPQIEEIDFNPVQAFPGGCFVLDARIKLKNQTPEGRR